MDLDTALDAMEENPSLRKACESTDSDVSHLTEVKQLDLHEDYDIQKQDSAGQELPVCMPRSALSEQRPKTVQEFVPSRPDALLTAIVNLGGVDNLEVASPTTAATAAAVDHEAWVKTHHKLPATVRGFAVYPSLRAMLQVFADGQTVSPRPFAAAFRTPVKIDAGTHADFR